jgi:hypothetical protein
MTSEARHLFFAAYQQIPRGSKPLVMTILKANLRETSVDPVARSQPTISSNFIGSGLTGTGGGSVSRSCW